VHLSHREKYIAIVAACVLVILVADQQVITPALDSRAALDTEQQKLQKEFENATWLFDRRRNIDGEFRDMQTKGLGTDPLGAESRLLHAIRDWAQETGMAVSSVKPERGDRDKESPVRVIDVLVSGTGTMQSVSRFLWRVESAPLPVRIASLQMGSRKDGADDLSVQLKLTTVYLAPEKEAGERGT